MHRITRILDDMMQRVNKATEGDTRYIFGRPATFTGGEWVIDGPKEEPTEPLETPGGTEGPQDGEEAKEDNGDAGEMTAQDVVDRFISFGPEEMLAKFPGGSVEGLDEAVGGRGDDIKEQMAIAIEEGIIDLSEFGEFSEYYEFRELDSLMGDIFDAPAPVDHSMDGDKAIKVATDAEALGLDITDYFDGSRDELLEEIAGRIGLDVSSMDAFGERGLWNLALGEGVLGDPSQLMDDISELKPAAKPFAPVDFQDETERLQKLGEKTKTLSDLLPDGSFSAMREGLQEKGYSLEQLDSISIYQQMGLALKEGVISEDTVIQYEQKAGLNEGAEGKMVELEPKDTDSYSEQEIADSLYSYLPPSIVGGEWNNPNRAKYDRIARDNNYGSHFEMAKALEMESENDFTPETIVQAVANGKLKIAPDILAEYSRGVGDESIRYQKKTGDPNAQKAHWTPQFMQNIENVHQQISEYESIESDTDYIREAADVINQPGSWIKNKWEGIMSDSGLDTIEEAVQHVQEQFQRSVDEDPVHVNFHLNPDVLKGMMSSGRTKTLMEGYKGSGSHDTKYRDQWENRISKYESSNFTGAERPTYGYLADDESLGRDVARQYGDSYIQLKPEAKKRMTFTAGNSSQGQGATFAGNDNFAYGDPEVVDGHFDGDFTTHLNQMANAYSYDAYKEAQIWGGVDLMNDVDHIGVPAHKIASIEDQLLDFSDHFGIPLVDKDDGNVIYEPGSR